jgi:hypothetical protein
MGAPANKLPGNKEIEDTGEMMRKTQNSKNRMEYTYLRIEGIL